MNKPIIRQAKIIKEKYDLEKDSYILFLARLVPEKGLQYLIEAFKQIDTNIKLVIAGGASHTNDYLDKIKASIKNDDKIIMTGFVQGQELEELYSNCLVYCLPSDVEGMPLSLLEAISFGCNCLVSDIEENKQIIEGTNMLTFKKGSIKDLKKKLLKILNDSNYRICVNKDFFKKYDWNNIEKKIEKIYSNREN